MISDKKDGIEVKCDTQEARNNSKNKERQVPESKREKLQLLAKRTITRTLEQYKKMSNTLDMRIQGSDLMSVCVTEKVRVYKKNNVSNNMII